MLVIYGMNGTTDRGSDRRDSVLAAPTSIPKLPDATASKLDRQRSHIIILNASVTVDRVSATRREFLVRGFHGTPYSPEIKVDNVPMYETVTSLPLVRWVSDPFGAHEGDVVKSAIDARAKYIVTCSISQDGVLVMRNVVKPGTGASPDNKVGKAACVYVVQPAPKPISEQKRAKD
jgi:hypothetical protein